MPTIAEQMAAHAEKGARRLDTVFKGQKTPWAARLDQDILNILDPHLDVLGQLFGSYTKGLKGTKCSDSAAPELGFTLPDELFNDPEAKEGLETAWVTEANKRL